MKFEPNCSSNELPLLNVENLNDFVHDINLSKSQTEFLDSGLRPKLVSIMLGIVFEDDLKMM